MNLVDQARLDRSVFEVGSLDDEDPDKAYWQTRSPQERMEALELLRQIIYGYDLARLDRSVFEVGSLDDEDPDKAYWQTRSPQERMEALELLRQIIYGYDPA